MIRQSNSITVLLFIQNNSYKNKLKHACLHRCSVYLYRDVQDIKGCLVICKYSPNSRCRPSSCLLAVLSMFLANSSPISSSRNEEILYSPPKQLNLVLKCSLLTVQFSSNYAAQLTSFLTYRKILPNLLRRQQLVMMNYAWDFR